jgi:hypothetical protein
VLQCHKGPFSRQTGLTAGDDFAELAKPAARKGGVWVTHVDGRAGREASGNGDSRLEAESHSGAVNIFFLPWPVDGKKLWFGLQRRSRLLGDGVWSPQG